MKCMLSLRVLLFFRLVSLSLGQSEASDTDYFYLADPINSNETFFPNLEEYDNFAPTNFDKNKGSSSEEKVEPDADNCGSPPVPEHATISRGAGPPYPNGTQVSYSCEFGYSADGASHASTCIKSEGKDMPSWTETHIVCIPRSCGDPGYVPNARRIGSLFTFPNSISFECEEGYERRGTSVHYCQVNGKWSGSLPKCIRLHCDEPEHPKNGRVIFSSLEYESELKYECDEGYVLRNHEPRYCSENKTWSGSEPVCSDSQCEKPVAPEHGSVKVVGDVRRVGSMALYTCNDGRALSGSAVSKCLDIGQWTFPTPKCVAPCSVPHISNGHIRKYIERKWRSPQPEQLATGAALDDNEEYFLRCDDNFEPKGKRGREVKVKCAQGIWEEIPECVPEKCKSPPPAMDTGRISRYDNHHGGTVVYHCKTHYEKTMYGNVTCQYGKWVGRKPSCTDTRCYLDQVQTTGLNQHVKNVYFSEESFNPSCQTGYTLVSKDARLTCKKGSWTGVLPNCTPDKCLTDPPPQENGRVAYFSELHNSKVEYECDPGYIQQTNSEVRCMYGSWTGYPPLCKVSGCHFANLKNVRGVDTISGDPILEGSYLDVRCYAGYHSSNFQPMCSGGVWSDDVAPLCIENDCPVLNINNGVFTELQTDKSSVNERGEKVESYIKKYVNTMIIAGTTLYFFCNSGYIPERQQNPLPITCIEGQWQPYPTCLNQPSGPNIDHNPTANRGISSPKPPSPITEASPFYPPYSSAGNPVFSATSSNPGSVQTPTPRPADNCHCTYMGSNQFDAYSDNRLLQSGEKVGRNAIIKFQCKVYGHMRLKGPEELACTRCRAWQSSEYPECVYPEVGETVLIFNKTKVKVYPTDIWQVDSGTDIRILCFANGISRYPEWGANVSNSNVNIEKSQMRSGNHMLSVNSLIIQKVKLQNTGFYQCQWRQSKPKVVHLKVVGKIILFDEIRNKDIEGDYLKVEQGKEVKILCFSDKAFGYPNWKSSVPNSLWFSHQASDGKYYIDRLVIQEAGVETNGLYSCKTGDNRKRDLRIEVTVKCKKFENSDQYFVQYNSEIRSVNSRAKFTCNADGLEKEVTCLPSGKWSDNPPTCKSKCQKFEESQHYSIFYEEEQTETRETVIKHARFTCANGVEKKAICLSNGKWQGEPPDCASEPTVVQCPVFNNIEGLSVTYSDGLEVGSEATFHCSLPNIKVGESRLLCLENGQWSGPTPTCTYKPTMVKCPVFDNTEGFRVIYSDGLEAGSEATFHCPLPRVKTGESRLFCLMNGQWSGDVPTCTFLNCSLANLGKEIPETVTPDLRGRKADSVTYKSEIALTCKGNKASIEPIVAKCSDNGQWKIPDVKCVPVKSSCKGFHLLSEPSPNLPQVDPVKDAYTFGEFISLSCAPGKVPSKPVQTIMCMQHGWSEPELPTCVKKPK